MKIIIKKFIKKNMNNFDNLPQELKIFILNYVGGKDKLNFAQTSKDNFKLLENPYDWKNIQDNLNGSLYYLKILNVEPEKGIKFSCQHGNSEALKYFSQKIPKYKMNKMIPELLKIPKTSEIFFKIVDHLIKNYRVNNDLFFEEMCKFDDINQIDYYMKNFTEWSPFNDFWNISIKHGHLKVVDYFIRKGLSNEMMMESNSILHAIISNKKKSIEYVINKNGLYEQDIEKAITQSYEQDLISRKTKNFLVKKFPGLIKIL